MAIGRLELPRRTGWRRRLFRQFSRAMRCAGLPLLLPLLLFLMTAVPPALGQEVSGVDRFERLLEQQNREQFQELDDGVPADRRALVDGGAFLTIDYLSVDDALHNNHGLREYSLTGYARVDLDDVYEFYARARTTYRDYNPGDSFDGFGSRLVNPDFDRAYFRFDSAKYEEAYHGFKPDVGLVLEGGRDLVYWGDGMVISQVLDGGIFKLDTPAITLDAFVGVTPTRTIDFDPSRPAFDYDTRRLFYGGMLSRQVGQQRPYVYVIGQNDLNRDQTVTTDAFGSVDVAHFNYNSYYIGFGTNGSLTDRLLAGCEFAYEGGYGLSNGSAFTMTGSTPQRNDSIAAAAGDIQLDYLPGGPNRSRISAELIGATGDTDRTFSDQTLGGNTAGTVDQSFNAFGLLNTGLAFAPAVSNLIASRIGASTFPLPVGDSLRRLQVGTDFFTYWKPCPHGGFDESTAAQPYLGCEPDLFMNWEMTSDLTLSGRYGIFFPSGAILSSPKDRQFIYVGLTYAL